MARLTGKYSVSTLASILAAGDDHLHVAPGEGALFPSSGDFMLRIGAGSSYEVVRATARSTDTISVTRAQDGTSAIEHAEGASVWTVISHTYLTELWAAIDALSASGGGWTGYDLTAAAENGFALAYQNPEDHEVWVEVMLDITTGSAAAAVLDMGTAATGTTHGDDVVDGLPINAALTMAFPAVKLAANGGAADYITAQILDEAGTGLVGRYYIRTWPV